MARPTIAVTYCTSCNYLPRALWLAAEILPDFQFEIGAFTFVPGDRGVFEWAVDGEVVSSKAASGRFPEPEELKELIFKRMEALR